MEHLLVIIKINNKYLHHNHLIKRGERERRIKFKYKELFLVFNECRTIYLLRHKEICKDSFLLIY